MESTPFRAYPQLMVRLVLKGSNMTHPDSLEKSEYAVTSLKLNEMPKIN